MVEVDKPRHYEAEDVPTLAKAFTFLACSSSGEIHGGLDWLRRPTPGETDTGPSTCSGVDTPTAAIEEAGGGGRGDADRSEDFGLGCEELTLDERYSQYNRWITEELWADQSWEHQDPPDYQARESKGRGSNELIEPACASDASLPQNPLRSCGPEESLPQHPPRGREESLLQNPLQGRSGPWADAAEPMQLQPQHPHPPTWKQNHRQKQPSAEHELLLPHDVDAQLEYLRRRQQQLSQHEQILLRQQQQQLQEQQGQLGTRHTMNSFQQQLQQQFQQQLQQQPQQQLQQQLQQRRNQQQQQQVQQLQQQQQQQPYRHQRPQQQPPWPKMLMGPQTGASSHDDMDVEGQAQQQQGEGAAESKTKKKNGPRTRRGGKRTSLIDIAKREQDRQAAKNESSAAVPIVRLCPRCRWRAEATFNFCLFCGEHLYIC
eukprot:TRINITY_DN1159_c3_g1_i2.p1 TRINITY_DN1159_c3_g1~~TRINITY_DN1159_c3_g1_i2.p1  ORF type:complete len:488 (-),score=127.37 TRINITY_DN1159_c3_g1_i2:116-1408(-)